MTNSNLPEFPEIPDVPIPTVPESVYEKVENAQVNFATRIYEMVHKLNETFLGGAIAMATSLSQVMQDYLVPTFSHIAEIATQLINTIANSNFPLSEEEATQRLDSHKKWGEYGWTYIPSMPISIFNTSPADIKEANNIAIKYCTKVTMENVFDSLRKWKLNHSDLDSAIYCYQNKQYKACALLLCGLIDSKLIRQQAGEHRPVGKKAVDYFKNLHGNYSEKMLVEVMFAYNLFAYLDELFANTHGFKAEPDTLNRNFIGHGMNQRTVRKRDCIQLFLALDNLMRFIDLATVSPEN